MTKEELVESAANWEMKAYRLQQQNTELTEKLRIINDAWAELAYRLTSLTEAVSNFMRVDQKYHDMMRGVK